MPDSRSKLVLLLQQVAGGLQTKDKPSVTFALVLAAIFGVILAVTGFVLYLEKRRAVAYAHELALLLEQKEHAKAMLELTERDKKIDELDAEISLRRVGILSIKRKHAEIAAIISAASTWSDLGVR